MTIHLVPYMAPVEPPVGSLDKFMQDNFPAGTEIVRCDYDPLHSGTWVQLASGAKIARSRQICKFPFPSRAERDRELPALFAWTLRRAKLILGFAAGKMVVS